ncbi:hypothetical protein DSCW_01270 [Desulfosarcina widdelii]|uniref:Uncharacterized protein n=1 Tax=Desulfosarcina widdelii TaxID=947919 RepID=A0A5K7YWK1_9BACT|nr:hypothetical protein [Desulfosarcina widdelii]BBO72710.1 hypothetical protein DSCW_01270 [Desulfosarcina widdelii]
MDLFTKNERTVHPVVESQNQLVFPEYDSIDELAKQINLAEDAGHTVQPQACIEIAVLLQETRNLMQSIYRSAAYCRTCMADEDIENSCECKEPLIGINPDIVACRLTEAAVVHGFNSREYQLLKGQPSIVWMVQRSCEVKEFPMLSNILPLSQLQFESTLLKRSCWQAFIKDDSTRVEAVDMLKFYIYPMLEGNDRSLIDLVKEYLRRYIGPWNGLQKIPAEIEKAMDSHRLFQLIMRRVHFALIFLAGDIQHKDLFTKIHSTQPWIAGGPEQCAMWLQRVAGRALSMEGSNV